MAYMHKKKMHLRTYVLMLLPCTGLAGTEVVISSLSRPGTTVTNALQSIANCAAVFENGIHVHGYNPLHEHPAIVGYPLPASPLHSGYRWLYHDPKHVIPTNALALGNKEAYHDSARRAFWRTSLNLDAWFVLSAAEARGASDVIVWIENDGVLPDCISMHAALNLFRASGASGASCFGRHNTVYGGEGAVCMMFARNHLAAILQHILGYCMVQPFDWILSDASRSQWTTYNVIQHGNSLSRHSSTLDA